MQIYSLDALNVTPLSTNYNSDNTVKLNKNTLLTENNIFFNFENILQTPNDLTTNNFSTLSLTDRKNLKDVLTNPPSWATAMWKAWSAWSDESERVEKASSRKNP